MGEMTHSHHWMIEPANGPMSKGTCACGAEGEFTNYVDATAYDSIVAKAPPGPVPKNVAKGRRELRELMEAAE